MTLDVIAAARRRTRRLIVAALIAAGVVAACVYPAGLYVNAHLDDPPLPPSPTGGPPPTAPATTTGGLLPVDSSWVRVAGVDLPISPTAGPARTSGGLARGFAHTRAGAVVAALHLLVRTTAQVGPAVFAPTIAEQVTGAHAAAMAAVVGESYRRGAAQAGLPYAQPLGDLPARVVGIRLDSCTDAQAVLSVLTAAPDATGVTRHAATAVSVVWQGEDWRLLAPPEGRWDDLVHLVDPAQTAGYTLLPGR